MWRQGSLSQGSRLCQPSPSGKKSRKDTRGELYTNKVGVDSHLVEVFKSEAREGVQLVRKAGRNLQILLLHCFAE
jgi:hypothetical protein